MCAKIDEKWKIADLSVKQNRKGNWKTGKMSKENVQHVDNCVAWLENCRSTGHGDKNELQQNGVRAESLSPVPPFCLRCLSFAKFLVSIRLKHIQLGH